MLSAFAHAHTPKFLCASRLSASPRTTVSATSMSSSVVRIAVVGDIPDLVLFTGRVLFSIVVYLPTGQPGDFGNENVDLVQSVADLEFPKAVILGNHDSWRTQEFSGKKKNRVQLQLECLGEEHVAYRSLDFPMLKLSVVGGRPFSHGTERMFRKRLLSSRYGVEDIDGSAKRIYKAALGVPGDHLVIFLAHNGPTGLGSEGNDICGKDWEVGGGDYGDPGNVVWASHGHDQKWEGHKLSYSMHLTRLLRCHHIFRPTSLTRASSTTDLAQAIALLKETTKFCIPLVVFGHMHKQLGDGGLRKMIAFGTDNTIYLNGAIVPRVKRLIDNQGTVNTSIMNNETSLATADSRGTTRAFTLVEIVDGRVDKIAETWVAVVGDMTTLQEEHILFKHGDEVLP
ncbi:hypothetical protein Patl1_14717 [Pistacia atlantica]|uniref:Uncharacterized protein n=1 Tax=Pistacia atlantica TaxID=434234 RepID=A0ACC1AVU2_9ROSI|nr:hypothetical protein Patl1_14717 [Pistacia atlantica]